MTRVINLFSLLSILNVSLVFAQEAPISPQKNNDGSSEVFPVFSYGDKFVLNDEFMRVFNKNKQGDSSPTKREIEEYLDLYIKFKLKVEQAYNLQMDTLPSFIKELAGYRKQLAQPYLTDKTVTDRLIREAFDRSKFEVNASHLLINCSSDAKPADTLAAYQKIVGLRTRIKNGENFEDVAKAFSEDPSAKNNNGVLGYFTSFQMIYPFENAAFNTPVGEVSMPIRTKYGYHLVYVSDKRESMGDMKVAHIMIKYYNPSQIDSTKERIDAVYNKLKEGGDWTSIVEEFSEDFNTNSKGGELSWINRTTPNIPIEFKDVAYTLKVDGEISEPIKTRFGWHIVKRIETKPMPSYEDSKELIRRKVERDSRSELNKEVVVARLKKENNFQEVSGLQAVQDSFTVDLLSAKYKKQEGIGIVLCKIGDRDYTDSYFFGYVATNQTRSNKSLTNAVNDIYDAFVQQINLDYEEGLLEKKYEAFKNIMQEYKDGILLFELTDKKVWTRAVKDTLGLKAFYDNNKAKYMWNKRADVDIFSCSDSKTKKLAMKLAKKGKSAKEILSRCNAKNPIAVTIESRKLEKSKDPLLEKINLKKGVFKIEDGNQQFKFVRVNDILTPTQKLLEENRGAITSDYQNYLEESWIKALKNSYPVQVYEDNVSRLYNN